MLGIDGLYQDNTGGVAAAGAAGSLREELKCSLGGAEIRQT